MSEEASVPGRVFTHNESLDFALALRNFKTHRLHEILASTIQAEVEASRRLEEIMFGSGQIYLPQFHAKNSHYINPLSGGAFGQQPSGWFPASW